MQVGNYKEVKKVLWIILFANLFVAILKIVVGTFIKSASMIADGFHSMSDGSSNIVGLIGVSIAAKPNDKEHPYGHRKFEVIASLFIGAMLVFVGGNIILEAIDRFKNPISPSITVESLIALLLTLVINILVTKYESKKGKKLSSYILVSDAKHTKSDIYVSIGVLVALVGVKLGLPPIIDPIASLIISGFILHSAYEVFKESTAVLVDQATVEEEYIKSIVKEFEEVEGVHKIRSRGSINDIHIDMHVLVNPNISVEKSHILTHEIEDKIKERLKMNVQVIVHIEPYYNKNN